MFSRRENNRGYTHFLCVLGVRNWDPSHKTLAERGLVRA